jgi:hypothetical protein
VLGGSHRGAGLAALDQAGGAALLVALECGNRANRIVNPGSDGSGGIMAGGREPPLAVPVERAQ